jgi:hypothetical protein
MKRIDPFESRGLDPADFRFEAMPSQGDTENTYQLEVHLSATEYPDVIEYLTQYKGDEREERIKELLRLGLQKSQAQDACTALIAKAKRP